MGLLDKVKSQAEQAASKAKEGVQEVQVKRELGQAYDELGKLAFELVEKGEIAHERLTPHVEKVRDLKARLEEHAPAATEPVAGARPAEQEKPAAEQPPAMPTE